MKTKITIKTVFGKIIFQYEKESNTIKETLLKAIKEGANLRGANLEGADLEGRDFCGRGLRRRLRRRFNVETTLYF